MIEVHCPKALKMEGVLKKFISIFFLSILLSFVSALAAASDSSSAQRKRTPTIAVLPFSDANPASQQNGLGHVVSAMIGTHLRNETNFIVLERASLMKVLDEKQYQEAGLTKETRDRLRQMLSVEVLLTGEVSVLHDLVQIDVRLISVATGEVVVADYASVQGEDALRGVVSKLAKTLEDRYLRQWMGNMTVLVHPVEGEVYIDDQFVGKSSTVIPLKLKDMLQGEYRLKVLAGGYQPFEQKVEIQPRTLREVQVGLKSLPGSLEISSEPLGAKVFINNRVVGITPCKLDTLQEGAYQIHMELKNFRDWDHRTQISSGQVSEVKAKLEVIQGQILVESNPVGAQVYIGTNLVGQSPLLIDNVTPGMVGLFLRAKGYSTWSQDVQVQPGEKVKLAPQLDRQTGKLTLVTGLSGTKAVITDANNVQVADVELPIFKRILDEGQYKIVVTKDKYYPESLAVNIAADKEVRNEFVMKLKPGRISIAHAAETPVDVFVDGVYKGKAGGLAVEVQEGKHQLFLRNFHGEKNMQIEVGADQTVEIPVSSLQVERGLSWWSALAAVLLAGAILIAAEVRK